jgi:hypothetical protein
MTKNLLNAEIRIRSLGAEGENKGVAKVCSFSVLMEAF